MTKDKAIEFSINPEMQPVSEPQDLMTVEDYARVAQINAILLAGFKASMHSLSGNRWRTRTEWQAVMDTFCHAPA